MHCRNDVASNLDAAKLLGSWYGLPMPRPNLPARPKSTLDFIAERSLSAADGVLPYLQERGINEEVIRQAITTQHRLEYLV